MPITLGNTADPALQPAAAAARPTEAGTEATKKALDQQELEGREAVKLIKQAEAPPPPDPDRGHRVDRKA